MLENSGKNKEISYYYILDKLVKEDKFEDMNQDWSMMGKRRQSKYYCISYGFMMT